MSYPCPRFIFELWCFGASDLICASDFDLPISIWERTLLTIRGNVLHFLFSWWWWRNE